MQKLRRSPKPEPEQPQAIEEYDEDGHALRMGFFEHLDELRRRVFRAFVGVVLGTCVGLFAASPVLRFILQPYADLYPDGRRLQTLGPTEAVVSFFKVALLVGGILAIPLITYQLFMFVLPGLKRSEKRIVFLSIPPITVLFLIGVFFAWSVLMPPAIAFLEGFQSDIFEPEWTAAEYLSFVTALLFWMGVAFETPLVFFVFSLLGLVTAGTLIRNWRIAIIGAAVAAALITPTVDPVNMFLVMAPLLVLYIFSIFLVMIGRRLSGVE